MLRTMTLLSVLLLHQGARAQETAGCEGEPLGLVAGAWHSTLDFTGGYEDDMRCGWAISCDTATRGQVPLLQFTAMDTEAANFDYVSVYDGPSAEARQIGEALGGHTVPAEMFGAAGGALFVSFRSDGSSTADGFALEYWCGAPSLGCTDAEAANFDPAAAVDDGSCLSCRSPTGTAGESPVDCAAAGLEPLAEELFKALRECDGVDKDCRNVAGNASDPCYAHVYWAMTDGIHDPNPTRIHTRYCEPLGRCLSPNSSFEEFQCNLMLQRQWSRAQAVCDYPCDYPACEAVAYASGRRMQEDGQAGCGLSQCCVAEDCHDAPGWTTNDGGADCDSIVRNGHCASTESYLCSADGVCPAAAVLSCTTPMAEWGEPPVDCAGANRIPLALTPGFFDAERACAGGACGLDDCCAPLDCHDAPGWTTSAGSDCDGMARIGYCASTESWACSADGVCPAVACCACGAPPAAAVLSCTTPMAEWGETPVDCAGANSIPLVLTPGFFDTEQACVGGACGLHDCCAPPHCHDAPGWRTSGGRDCDYLVQSGHCASTESDHCSADGVCPAAACCACGATPAAAVLSCATPMAEWGEPPVDCAGANRIPLALTPGFFDAEQVCAGGECGLDDCCAPLHCHDAPGWRRRGGGDCDSMAQNGYCLSTELYHRSADGVCPAAACCACGAPPATAVLSCATPTAEWGEPPVDCVKANRIPLAPTPGFFGGEQTCVGGECGLNDCCAPPHCHDAPGWTAAIDGFFGTLQDCAVTAKDGLCASTESDHCSADGVCPAAACCTCGGGSVELLPSCANPMGASWDELAIDCAMRARIALPEPAGPGECAGVVCELDDCCRPADWAPVCTGADVKVFFSFLANMMQARDDDDIIDPACATCMRAHEGTFIFPPYCFPLPTRTACSAADTAVDLHDDDAVALLGDACLACLIVLESDNNNNSPDNNPDFWGPCTGGGAPPSPTSPAAAEDSSSSGVIIVIVVLLLALGGGGGAFLMMQQK
jgi:hypothetical protein